jgi:hypothetical protein
LCNDPVRNVQDQVVQMISLIENGLPKATVNGERENHD